MKASLLSASAALLVLLASGCEHLSNCEPTPRCVKGIVLANTCMAGTLIQLQGVSSGGQTIEYNFDGTGKKRYDHVISTYSELNGLSRKGQTIYFTYQQGGKEPDFRCLAADGPDTPVAVYTVSNVSDSACNEGEVTTN
ncbi:hypothetical protein [Hymenobacter koreensis]|uniref:C-type lysozyme inhibitor domain-containing protein n=1 Tax=Hymenobacter koreensis TaxID=1084523 RepID=A0ABP8IT75_9BACT